MTEREVAVLLPYKITLLSNHKHALRLEIEVLLPYKITLLSNMKVTQIATILSFTTL